MISFVLRKRLFGFLFVI